MVRYDMHGHEKTTGGEIETYVYDSSKDSCGLTQNRAPTETEKRMNTTSTKTTMTAQIKTIYMNEPLA
jgi:hypothetical protein